MSDTEDIHAILTHLHVALDAIRPGARYVITAQDEGLTILFADHGGDLTASNIAIQSGPPRTASNASGWTPAPIELRRMSVIANTGHVAGLPDALVTLLPLIESSAPALPADHTGSLETTARESDTYRSLTE